MKLRPLCVSALVVMIAMAAGCHEYDTGGAEAPASSSSGAASGSSSSSGQSAESRSSSSGGEPVGGASSSSGDATSSSSSGGEGGGSSSSSGGSGCSAALPATILPIVSASCGALPVRPIEQAIAATVFASMPVRSGGTILPGQYELVKAELPNVGLGASRIDGVYVFHEDGRMTLHQVVFDVGGQGVQYDVEIQGTYSVSGSTLSLNESCSTNANGPMAALGFRVEQQGCDVFLEVGDSTFSLRYKRRREP